MVPPPTFGQQNIGWINAGAVGGTVLHWRLYEEGASAQEPPVADEKMPLYIGHPGFWKRLNCADCFNSDFLVRQDTDLDRVLIQCDLKSDASKVGDQTQASMCGLGVVNYGECEMAIGMPDQAVTDIVTLLDRVKDASRIVTLLDRV